MKQRLHTLRRNDSGFTLVELLVVVLILGVLSGVVVFAVSNFNNQGVEAACKADVKNVEIADEAYVAKNSGHAADTKALVDAGYLREAPPAAVGGGAKYAVTMTNGVITSVGC